MLLTDLIEWSSDFSLGSEQNKMPNSKREELIKKGHGKRRFKCGHHVQCKCMRAIHEPFEYEVDKDCPDCCKNAIVNLDGIDALAGGDEELRGLGREREAL